MHDCEGELVTNDIGPCAELEDGTIKRRAAIHQQSGLAARYDPSDGLTRAQCAETWTEANDASSAANWLSALDSASNPLFDWLDGLTTAEQARQWAAAKENYQIALLAVP